MSREGGLAGLALGRAEPDGQVDPEHRVGRGRPRAQSVEGLGVVPQGVGGGQRGESGVAGLPRVADRLGRSMGWVALDQCRASSPTSEPGGVAAELFQGLGHLPVGPGPPRGAQVLVEGVLDEGVGEVVAPGGVGQLPHQGDRRRRVEDVEQLVLGDARRPGQQVEVEVAADDRGDRQHPFGVRPESHHPAADHLAHAVGQGLLRPGCPRPPIGPLASW